VSIRTKLIGFSRIGCVPQYGVQHQIQSQLFLRALDIINPVCKIRIKDEQERKNATII
jgi:hypothetical protein